MRFKCGTLSFCMLLLVSLVHAADVGKNKGAPLRPEYRIIEKWRGTWDVKAMRHQPQPAQQVTYVEKFEWVLGGRYLRSETSRKSDGGQSMSIFWWDPFGKAYRFVIYDSSAIVVVLPPPTWHEDTQTMVWESGLLEPINYNGHAKFIDENTMRWKSLWKDWKGTVILDLEGTSLRRK